MAPPKRRVTDRVSSTGRKSGGRQHAPATGGAQRLYEETLQGGSTMNLASGKFAEVSEDHDPSKPEHYIVAGEPHPSTGERYPTIHARLPGHVLSSAQWESMSPQTRSLKPFSPEMAEQHTQRLRAEAAAVPGHDPHQLASIGTWAVPREGEGGAQHPRYGQVDIDVSAAATDKHLADRVAEGRAEEATFATNPMRNVPTIVGHALGMAYHPLDAGLRAEHAARRGVTDAAA